MEINDGVDDERAQAITEDQAERVVRRRVMIEEGGVFGITGEEYKGGEVPVGLLGLSNGLLFLNSFISQII